MNKQLRDTKTRIIKAGEEAIEQLILVAKEKIIMVATDEDELDVTSIKNAASTKKMAIFDAFEILDRIESEKALLDSENGELDRTDTNQGFAERRAGK